MPARVRRLIKRPRQAEALSSPSPLAGEADSSVADPTLTKSAATDSIAGSGHPSLDSRPSRAPEPIPIAAPVLVAAVSTQEPTAEPLESDERVVTQAPELRTGAAQIQRAPDPNAASDPPPPPPPGQPTDSKGGGGAGSATAISVKNTSREVSANSLSALWDALTRSGTREAASVLPKLTPAPQYEYDESDKVTKAVVTVVETKEMPKWTEAEAQCAPIKAEWTRFYRVLDAHEDRHIAIDKKHYANVHLKLVGKKKEEGWQTLDAVVEAADKENEAYDQQSGHGVNEGANINTAVQCAPEKVPATADPSAPPSPPTPPPAPPPPSGSFPTVSAVAAGLQAKLEVSQPGDPLEEEAERVAEAVTRDEPTAPTSPPTGRAVQRQCAAPGSCDCDRCRAASARPGHDAESIVRPVVSGGRGAPLDRDTRTFMESRLGHDFGQVRIHTDDTAARSAASLSAHAYAFGSDVVFAAGRYAPNAPEGRRLLAHELTHVAQQRAAAPAIHRQAVPQSPVPPTATPPGAPGPQSVGGSVRLKVGTGPDPERTSNSLNSGAGIVVASLNAEETFASLRQMGAEGMWNLACVAGNLSRWAATAPDPAPNASPSGGGEGVKIMAADGADAGFEDKYRAVFPAFKRHVQAFYKSFKDFEKSFKERGTQATLSLIVESRARTKKTIDDLGIEAVVEHERGPVGTEYNTSYKSKSDKIKQLTEAATKLAVKQEEVDKLTKQRDDGPGIAHWAFTSQAELDKERNALDKKVADARIAWLGEKQEALGKFPVLSWFTTAAALRSLSTSAASAHHIGAKLFEVLDNIKELEDKLKPDNNRILTLPEHLDRLKDTFRLNLFERQVVDYMRAKYTGDIEMGQRVAVLIAVVLAAIAAAPTGGSSLVIVGAALAEAGINTILLLQAYDQYSLEKAAAGSDEDKIKALSSEDPSFGWLAFQIVTTAAGLKGAAGTVMKELKVVFAEARTGYKVAAATGEASQLKTALKNARVPPEAAEGIVARAIKESVAILEGIAKGGPEGIKAALEMLKTSPNFYAVRLAVWRLKAGANEGLVRQNLQAARQQVINQIVADVKGKYPKATFVVTDQGFEKPLVVKIGTTEPVAAPPPASPSTPPPSAAPPPSATAAATVPAGASATAAADPLPPGVDKTPVQPPSSGLLVQAGGPDGEAAKAAAALADTAVQASPMGAPAPSAPAGPIAPGAKSVSVPGGFRPPMAVPEGVDQALNAADELKAVPQAAFGAAPAAAGADLAVQIEDTLAPFGSMQPDMKLFYGIRPNLPKPKYSGIYFTVSKRFEVDAGMTAKFAKKGSSGKVILKDLSSDQTAPQLFMFKPGAKEAVLMPFYKIDPGTYFVRGRAAYDLAMELPTIKQDLVPLGVVVYNGEVGSLQPLLKNTESLGDLLEGKPMNPTLTPDYAKQLGQDIWDHNPEFAKMRENLRAYDHVINNPDRNKGNYMVEFNDDMTVKRIYGIDQDAALTPGARTVLLPDREIVPRGVATPFTGPGLPGDKQQQTLGKISKTLYDEFLQMKVNEGSIREHLRMAYGMEQATADGIFRRLDEVLSDYNLRLQTMKPEDVFHD